MAEADDDQQTVPKVITCLSSLLQRVAESNDKRRLFQSQKMSVFLGLTRPTISITTYLHRIFKHANCSPCCFVIAYVYLDRFMQMHPSLPFNSFNVHRLLITSVLVSAQFMDDICYINAYYAKVGSISTEEMNILEVDFLFGLGVQLNVKPDTFRTYFCFLQREMRLQTPPPLQDLAEPYQNVNNGRPLKIHCCFNEDESTHQQQLAV
ncbi:hypothetical protein ES332_A09G288500v1 [Gossypium tomentosum]|uniref:Cyclin n=1 Tax=Gossypium tomentosum TaxID=34277 RepID=A0A5D2P9N8_GOSTO|nr:hypothetical protein ES332_A09G288500v1 [Gossypium tomentosum]